jgi:hypothetical protein
VPLYFQLICHTSKLICPNHDCTIVPLHNASTAEPLNLVYHSQSLYTQTDWQHSWKPVKNRGVHTYTYTCIHTYAHLHIHRKKRRTHTYVNTCTLGIWPTFLLSLSRAPLHVRRRSLSAVCRLPSAVYSPLSAVCCLLNHTCYVVPVTSVCCRSPLSSVLA